MRITALKPGVTTEYGISVPVSTTVTVNDIYGKDLVTSGMAADTDNVLPEQSNTPFLPYVGASRGSVFSPTETKRRFLASLPNGESFRSQRALAAVPAWAAGVVVSPGYVCHNAGNMYWCTGTLSTGASMPAVGVTTVTAPTGTGSAVIPTATDLLRWLYMGAYDPSVVMDDQSDTPTVSVNAMASAGLTRRYNTQVAADLAAMYVTGSPFVNALGSGGGINGIGNSGLGYNSLSVDVMTDAPVLGLWALQSGGGDALRATINRKLLYHFTGFGNPFVAAGTNNNFGFILDWSSKPNKTRRVRIPVRTNGVFTGFWVDPKYSIWKPENPNRYRLHVEGDSITQGGQPANGGYSAGQRLAELLGCDDVWDTSRGGTGFINTGGGPNLVARLPLVIAAAPDILFVRPINNDVGSDGTYNTSTRIVAYTNYFSTLLAALPNLIIICGGGYATGAANLTTTASSAWQVEQDMAYAIAKFNHPQVKFLPTVSDPAGRWLFGDGHTGTTGNSTHGNSDLFVGDGSDTLHPNVRYYESICRREVDGIIGIMNSLTFG